MPHSLSVRGVGFGGGGGQDFPVLFLLLIGHFKVFSLATDWSFWRLLGANLSCVALSLTLLDQYNSKHEHV